MTNRFKTSLAAGVVAAALASAAPFVIAQDAPQRRGPGPGFGGPPPDGMQGGPGRRGPGGPMGFGLPLRELDLSEEQRTQIRTIGESHQAEFKQIGEKIGAARAAMRALLEADTLDESAIRAKSVEVAAAEADLAILNARVRAESMQVLTAEQQTKLKEMRASRMKRRG